MGAAFEVNRQMCDIVLLAKENIRLGKENQERAKLLDEAFKKKFGILKENDMKKKKMTKAEAFEWLKCKKVSVANREINDKVQLKLFACGVEWKHHGTDVCHYGDYLVINPDGFLCHCDGLGSDYWRRLFHEEISADDILSIEIVEEEEDELNSYAKIAKLAQPLMDYLREIRSSERICISQENVVAEPMPTLISGGMKGC